MTTNFGVKIGEIGLFAFIRRSDIWKRIAISNTYDLKRFICDDGYIV